jgi:hypothetical protein
MKDPIVITFDCEETARMYAEIQNLHFFGKAEKSYHFTYEEVYPLWEVIMKLFKN